jgi:hypothetical protein
MNTLELVNNTLSLIGERPIASSTGSLGGITRSALTTAFYSVIQQTRASAFEQILTYTATNPDYLVPIGALPDTVVQLNKMYYTDDNSRVFELKSQRLELLQFFPTSYTLIGNNIYLTNSFNRPVDIFASVLNVPDLTADGVDSGLPKYLIAPVSHLAASILAVSYLDDANVASVHRNMAEELIILVRGQLGRTRARSFNIGSINV